MAYNGKRLHKSESDKKLCGVCGGIVLAAMGVIFFIAAFIRAWRSLKQGEKEKGGPER